jgi:hypothetical protein
MVVIAGLKIGVRWGYIGNFCQGRLALTLFHLMWFPCFKIFKKLDKKSRKAANHPAFYHSPTSRVYDQPGCCQYCLLCEFPDNSVALAVGGQGNT